MLDQVQTELLDRIQTLIRKRDYHQAEAKRLRTEASEQEQVAGEHSALLSQFAELLEVAGLTKPQSPNVMIRIDGKVKPADLDNIRDIVRAAMNSSVAPRA